MVVSVSGMTLYLSENSAPLFRGISFDLDDGAIALLEGGAGSGKTMLGMCVCGVLPLTTGYWRLEGSIQVFNRPIEQGVHSEAIGIVLEKSSTQLSGLKSSVRQELAFPLECIGIPSKECGERIERIAHEFRLSHLLDRNLKTVSGGELQRLVIAAALIARPRFLFLDRPLTEIDDAFRPSILAHVRKHVEALGGGAIMAEDAWMLPDFSFSQTIELTSKTIAASFPAPRRIASYRRESIALDISSLMFAYEGQKPLFTGFSLTMHHGEIVFLTGDNGSGKTTLAKLVTGILTPAEGDIIIDGVSAKTIRARDRYGMVGYALQNPDSQFCRKTVEDELKLLPIFDGFANDIAAILGIDRLKTHHPFELTQAQKKRLAMAIACSGTKRIVILDEPSQYQDVEGFSRVVDAIASCAESGTAVLIITHDTRFFTTFPDARVIHLP